MILPVRIVGLLVLCVLGCGDSPPATPDAPPQTPDASAGGYVVGRSGTRLKLSWFETDGVRSPFSDGFFDTELGVSCRPELWSDHVERCTPRFSPVAAEFWYTDSNCTVAVFETPTRPDAENSYYPTVTTLPGGCEGGVIDHVYHLGNELTMTHAYRMAGGNCIMSPTSGYHLYERIEVPASDLVEVSKSYDPTGAVQQMRWNSPDGMYWYRPAGFDTALNAPCTYQQDSATTAYCQVETASSVWSDSACTSLLAAKNSACTPPAYAYVPKGCGASALEHQVVAVGAPVTVNTVYTGPGCTASNDDPQKAYYTTSSTIMSEQPLDRVRESASSRLKPIFLNSSGGVHYQTNLFYDSVLDIECGFGTPTGTTSRCGPTSAEPTKVLYTDENCTMPFVAVQVDNDPYACPNDPPRVPAFGVTYENGTIELHRVMGEHVGRVYDFTSMCRLYPEFGTPPWRIYDAESTPTTNLETATVVVDP